MITPRQAIVLLVLCVVGYLVVVVQERAHAEPAPAFDRSLVERLIRAEERQAQALERLTEATERKCR